MPENKQLTLSTFDGRLMDGLVFCGKVYDLFDQVKDAPNGLEHIRLRSTKLAKRLMEELIPITRYMQARYREGNRIRIRWFGGSQAYDAILRISGDVVTRGGAPKKLTVEVTIAAHSNDYLVRQQLHQQGMTFGPKNIQRNKKTKQITSEPYGYTNDERGIDLARQIIQRLEAKTVKNYPPDTILIIACFSDGFILEEDWHQAVGLVEKAQQHLAFREVFLYESMRLYSTTLYGEQKRKRTRTRSKSLIA